MHKIVKNYFFLFTRAGKGVKEKKTQNKYVFIKKYIRVLIVQPCLFFRCQGENQRPVFRRNLYMDVTLLSSSNKVEITLK